ncbi:ATP-binding protein [Sphingomonas cynarae]
MKRIGWSMLLTIACSTAAVAADPNATRFDRQIAAARESMLTSPPSASKAATEAAVTARRIDDPQERRIAIATTDWLRAEANSRLGDFNKAKRYIDAAAAIILPAESQLAGDILLTRGGVHGARFDVAASLLDYQAAFQIFRKIGNARSQAIALMLIASLYTDGRDNLSALRYLEQATEIYHGDPSLLISLHNGRGGVLQDLGRHDEAEGQFRLAMHYVAQVKSQALEATVLRNIARNRLKAGQVDAAERAVRRSLLLTVQDRDAGARSQLLAVAAQAAVQRGNTTQAADLIERSFAGVDPTTTGVVWREAHATAYAVFSKLGRDDLALAHLVALKRLDDEATKLAITTSTALMAARFDYANQELRIANLKADELRRSVAFEQARARIERTIFLGVGGATAIVIALLAASLFAIRRSRNEARSANDDLGRSNDALGKALAAKTEFLATTSHEIRTPLNGILGMTQVMLADDALHGPTRERVSVVHGAGLTMRALVDDILDVAKMETGNLSVEQAPFDLRDTIREASRMWEAQAAAKGLTFAVDLDACPTRILGDAARVRQVVFNLLANGLKFTATGGISLAARAAANGEMVAITVSDTGIGIAVDKQGTIFESFRQADAGTTRQYGGTGLGLSICRNLARAMGGEVTVASRPGEGATFTVTLPLVAVAPEPIRAADPAVSDAAGGALMVVDRNPITRSMWKSLLGPHTDHLIFVSTATDAVAALDDRRIDHILIDDATIVADPLSDAALDNLAGAARAAGVVTVLLWPADRSAPDVPVTRIVHKPVTGPVLIAALFAKGHDEPSDRTLVSGTA